MDHTQYPEGGQKEWGWLGQSSNADRLDMLLYVHLACYWIYVYSMLAITYFSFLKVSFVYPLYSEWNKKKGRWTFVDRSGQATGGDQKADSAPPQAQPQSSA